MSHTVHLALGARDGRPRVQIAGGITHLERSGVVPVAFSSLWETEPVGIGPGPPVLNAAMEVRTSLGPRALLALLKEAEDESGRRREPPERRTLDLDLLLYGDIVMDSSDLTIPHPRFHRRRFNLVPLAEIAADLRHPVDGRTVRQLLEECTDRSWVRPAGPWEPSLKAPGGSGKIRAYPGSGPQRADLSR